MTDEAYTNRDNAFHSFSLSGNLNSTIYPFTNYISPVTLCIASKKTDTHTNSMVPIMKISFSRKICPVC